MSIDYNLKVDSLLLLFTAVRLVCMTNFLAMLAFDGIFLVFLHDWMPLLSLKRILEKRSAESFF